MLVCVGLKYRGHFLTGERVERRLAAVLAADVAGYSRLMGADEEGTLARLKALRKALVDPTIAKHRGRIVKTTGDGMLVEFASAVDAARSAVEVQRGMAEQNASVPPDQRIEFRIGVHSGDIIFDDNDIFGDGVNIAARLEGIADPGSICISDDAQRQIRGKVDVVFEDMGLQALKNIAEPMRAWRVRLDGDAVHAKPSTAPDATLALPDKPSIAVLPFQNMSGDPEQEYFADGMVEDIITALSRFKSLFVIARNSSFTYKGKAVDIKQVGRELGVRYVLEGSVRKAGGKVRITGQLIDAATGVHLWAERFDGPLEDIFEVQDQVTISVIGALLPQLEQAEVQRARGKPTDSLSAYDCFMRAQNYSRQLTQAAYHEASNYLERAIALDASFGLAKAFLAHSLVLGTLQGWAGPQDRERAVELAKASLESGEDDPSLLRCAGHTLGFFTREHDRAVSLLERAAELNPNSSGVLWSLGWVRCFAVKDANLAIQAFERAMRLSPRDPDYHFMLGGLAFAHSMAGQDERALELAWRCIQLKPKLALAHRAYISALANLGRLDEAKAAARTLLEFDPGFTISGRAAQFRESAFTRRYNAGLLAAGLPE